MSSIDTKFPIALPETAELRLTGADFRTHIQDAVLLSARETDEVSTAEAGKPEHDEEATLVSATTSISGFSDLAVEAKDENSRSQDKQDFTTTRVPVDAAKATPPDHPFVAGLKTFTPTSEAPPDLENKMLTENADVAHSSAKDPLVDLFFELEEVLSGPKLLNLLSRAWASDSLATLKIIFNARSIHLGKSSRSTFYRCCGWLRTHHPKTLLLCLQWLALPVIEKPKSNQAGTKSDQSKAAIAPSGIADD